MDLRREYLILFFYFLFVDIGTVTSSLSLVVRIRVLDIVIVTFSDVPWSHRCLGFGKSYGVTWLSYFGLREGESPGLLQLRSTTHPAQTTLS